jgi:ADP-heptose:LPS heptosyltransferase
MKQSEISFRNLTGKLTLIELVSVMAESKLVITNDSGPFHIAVALGKRVVCISNGNNYGRFTPYPAAMHTKSLVNYPDDVLRLTEVERLGKFSREVRDVDINSIKPEAVYYSVKQLIVN